MLKIVSEEKVTFRVAERPDLPDITVWKDRSVTFRYMTIAAQDVAAFVILALTMYKEAGVITEQEASSVAIDIAEDQLGITNEPMEMLTPEEAALIHDSVESLRPAIEKGIDGTAPPW